MGCAVDTADTADVPPIMRRAAETTQLVLACAQRVRAAFLNREPIDELMAEFNLLATVNDQVIRDFQAAKRAGKVPPSAAGYRLAVEMAQAAEEIQVALADVIRAAEGR